MIEPSVLIPHFIFLLRSITSHNDPDDPPSIAAALARTPVASVFVMVAGLATMGISTLVHLVKLPAEWDASIRRALPILRQGSYLSPEDEQGARRILTAAAFTHVAASLASLLNLWRWIVFLRR